MVQGRWGHKAVYVPTSNMVYVVGGEISDRNGGPLKITNEVLQLNLSQSNPSPETLVTSSLLPTAFHSLAYSPSTNQLVSFGGMTSSCRTDSILHSLDLDNTNGNLTWTSETSSGLLRRRGAGMVHLEATVGEAEGKLMVFGGAVDQYVCSSTSSYYSAFDVIPYPLSDAAVHNSDKMAASFSSPIGVSDFAMTALANDTVLFVGGTDVNGDMVKMDKLTAWSDEQDWYSLNLMGEIPEARVGASMVAHPTLKDLVILHGGAIQDGASTSATASISLLNLTTLTWSSPYNVQPARQDARAWHSDIITSSGVLVSAFGIGAGNNPHSEVNFLDMRDSNVANWGWKRTWTTNMLNSNPASGPATGPTSGTTSPGSGSAANVKVPSTSSNVANAEENGDDGSLKKILPPTLIIGLVLLGLLVWLARRQVNIVRRRRLARHFEIDNTHDEEGNRRASLFEPVTQFMAKRGWNRSSPFAGLPRPFGGVRIPDGDETETAGWQSSLAGVVGRLTGKNQTQATSSGEMRQVDGRNVSRTQWEEIDFGLGRVDEQRRSSVGPTRPGTPGRPSEDTSRQIPAREFNKNRGRVSFPPDNEPVDPAYLPALVVVPPSNPSTPNSEPRAEDPFTDYPVLMPSPRIHETISEKPEVDLKTRAEWDELEREVETAQPFRRSGTVSSTHSARSTGSKEIEPLPRLSFEQKTSSEFSNSLSSYGIGLGKPITRRASGNDSVGSAIAGRSVSSPSSHSPPRDYNSAATVGYSPSYVRDLITGHAQSPARIPRSGELSRSSTMSDRPHSSVNLFNKYQSDDGDSSLSLADYRMDGAPVRVQRLSNPPRFPPPTSPLPQAPSTGVSRRVSTSDALERSSDNVGTLARPTGEVRQLRVVNATPRPDEVDEFGSKA